MESAQSEDFGEPEPSESDSNGEDVDMKQEFSPDPSVDVVSAAKSDLSTKHHNHAQKRRRVTRACDECRR